MRCDTVGEDQVAQMDHIVDLLIAVRNIDLSREFAALLPLMSAEERELIIARLLQLLLEFLVEILSIRQNLLPLVLLQL